LEAGCDDYDTKPIDFSRLLTKIESLLEKKRLPAPQPEVRRHVRRS
jgi:DNA-binding response OmpR family regulator